MSATWFQHRYKTVAPGALADEARKNLQLILKMTPIGPSIRDLPVVLHPTQVAQRTKMQDEIEKMYEDA